ncbi:uncharacterized protein LOC134710551 [Mytilus trossulus]|uniref:uncharacterized protein LOC134710551 n=1 Tax=Mytilus trossulus TaxID=6551 RepID=UPI0030071611
MASSSCTDVCTLCQENDELRQAVTWCTECEVFMCMDCNKHHNRSRSCKCHKTMSVEDYYNLPAFMRKISSQCQEHNKKFELYCSFHACPCCVQCVTKHQKCKDMKPLSDILTNVKSSASVQLLENDLKVLKENFDHISKYLKSRITENRIQKTKAIEEVRTMRKSIDDYINRLEQQILDDLESNHSKLKSYMNTLLNQVEHRSVEIYKLQKEFSKMTQYATQLQIYVGLRKIEKTTSEAAKYIDDLESGDQLEENNLELEISSALKLILQDVKSFGDIHITVSSSTVQIKARRKDQAQALVHTIPVIEQIKPLFLKKVTMPDGVDHETDYACRILHDDNFVFLDRRHDQLLLFNKEGILIRKVMTFEGNPNDLCIVSNNTVAISFQTIKQSALVDIEKNKIIKIINLSDICHKVTSDGQVLVLYKYGNCHNKCTIVNLKDMTQTFLGVGGTCISLFKENIYCTHFTSNKVSCFKRNGEPLWTFMHDAITFSTGHALDINGFIYVATLGTNEIVVVSPKEKTNKTLLSFAIPNGDTYPIGIDINKDTGMMMVLCRTTGDRPSILVYKI